MLWYIKKMFQENMLLDLTAAPNQSMYFYSLILLLSTSLLRLQNLKTTLPIITFPYTKSQWCSHLLLCDFGFWSIIELIKHRNDRSFCLFASLLLNFQHRLQSPTITIVLDPPLTLLTKIKREKLIIFQNNILSYKTLIK